MISSVKAQKSRLKYLLSYNDEVLTESTPDDLEIKYVEIGDVKFDQGITNHTEYTFEKSPSRARRIVRDGDVILSTVRTYLKAVAGISKPPENLIVSTGFVVLRPNNLVFHPRFASYFFQTEYLLREVVSKSVGVSYPAVRPEDIVNMGVDIPPLETQKQIADFLDKETTRIDTLISKKQKQIELLQEKRQAIITQSVTKGLNPYVKMKNSGVEWIGEIPEHWDVLRMRFLMEINPPKSKCKILDHSKEISFVPMELVGDRGEIDTTNRKSIEEVYNGYTFFEDGDVVFAKITPCFENGKGAVARNLVNKTGFGTTELHVLRPYQDILNNDYLYLIIHSYIFRKIGESTMYGAGGQKRVPENYIKNFPLPLPPIHEQRDILKNANDEVSRIDDLENKINRSIHLLKEYRSSLITHAVSGQIDISKYEVSK